MSSKRERQRLRDMIDNADAIATYIEGVTEAEFGSDRRTLDAVERCLERICEASVKIGEERMAELAPDVPVRRLRSLGNALRHDYDVVDRRTLWLLISVDLPKLRSDCARALERLGEP
jgi:uncharacterized protein with HEPN domain